MKINNLHADPYDVAGVFFMPICLTIKSSNNMTIYQCLLELDELGYLKPLINKGVISSHFVQWMEIEDYSLEHTEASLAEISYNFTGTKTTIFRALEFMDQPLT